MSKEQSTILKGVAILMMLWYHLFNIAELEDVCFPLIHIQQKALVAYLGNATYPVSFFMILSGYGLTYLFKHNRLDVKGQCRRLLKLYIHYWLILLIFVTIGHFINPAVYPNNFIYIIANITGIRCTYNGETWFLLPYAIISLCSYWIIDFVYHLNDRKKIAITLIVYAFFFLSARHLAYHLPYNPFLVTLLIQPVYYIQLTFYFSLGIILFRLIEKNIMLRGYKQFVYIFLIVCLVIVKSLFKITIADGFYALLFIILFLNISLNKYLTILLHALGNRSMGMWMTHTFFSTYLFSDFIYGFKYPLLIFTILVIVSYLTAVLIMRIGKRIINVIEL